MVYKRKRAGEENWYVAVPTRTGRVKRSAGTSHKATARAMERMLEELGPKGQRAWDLLDRIFDNTLSLGRLYDAYRLNALGKLHDEMQEVDLEEYIEAWTRWLGDRVKKDTREHYVAQLRTLIPEGKAFARSGFTSAAIATWLAGRTALTQKRKASIRQKPRRKKDPPLRNITGSTKRKYLAAVRSFATYLVEIGVLTSNPVRDVQAPPPGKPRTVEIDFKDVRRIVEGALQPYQAIYALLYGGGLEISAALACIESDVDLKRREVRARGTKAHTRDRIVRIADWAWSYIEDYVGLLTPGERLFRGVDRWEVGRAHRDRLVALGIPHHRLHDARHFYAIRAVRAGTPYELVARQLGHADVTMVARIYGRYAPRSDERDRWERIASQLDEPAKAPERNEKDGHVGAKAGANPQNDSSQPPVSDWLADSRGGTRTLDPGIMSAVL